MVGVESYKLRRNSVDRSVSSKWWLMNGDWWTLLSCLHLRCMSFSCATSFRSPNPVGIACISLSRDLWNFIFSTKLLLLHYWYLTKPRRRGLVATKERTTIKHSHYHFNIDFFFCWTNIKQLLHGHFTFTCPFSSSRDRPPNSSGSFSTWRANNFFWSRNIN